MKKKVKLILLMTIIFVTAFCNFCYADEIDPMVSIDAKWEYGIPIVIIIGLIVIATSIAAIIVLMKSRKQRKQGNIKGDF